MTAYVHTLLVCPICAGDLQLSSAAICHNCAAEFPCTDGMISLVSEGARTALDDIDYDAFYRVDESASNAIVAQCLEVLGERMPHKVSTFLEIGAGTGLFTLGFLQQVPMERAIITDISPGMLARCRKRLQDGGVETRVAVEYATWDCDRNCFRPGTFDLVAGFSAVHHVLDYERLFGYVQKALKPDGMALFLEPNYRFHTVLIDLVAEVLCSVPKDDPIWTDTDRNAVLCWLFENNTNLRFRGDAYMLAGREDKHIFDGGELRRAAAAAGFADVELVPFGGREGCYSAIDVYSAQLDLTAAARSDLLARCARMLPGPFVHLAEEDRAASFLILLHNSSVAAARSSIGVSPEFSLASPAPSFRYAIIITTERQGDQLDIAMTGWVLGYADVTYMILTVAGKRLRFPVYRMRPDVHEALNADRALPLRRALFCGIERIAPQFVTVSDDGVMANASIVTADKRELGLWKVWLANRSATYQYTKFTR